MFFVNKSRGVMHIYNISSPHIEHHDRRLRKHKKGPNSKSHGVVKRKFPPYFHFRHDNDLAFYHWSKL